MPFRNLFLVSVSSRGIPSGSDGGRMLGRVAWVVRAIIRHIRLVILIEVVIEVGHFICALGL